MEDPLVKSASAACPQHEKGKCRPVTGPGQAVAPEVKKSSRGQMATDENSGEQAETSLAGFLPEIDAVAFLARSEIAKLKRLNDETPNENRVKDLVALTRVMQTLSDLASDARRAEQEQNGGSRNIHQFRKQLERKIAALDSDGED